MKRSLVILCMMAMLFTASCYVEKQEYFPDIKPDKLLKVIEELLRDSISDGKFEVDTNARMIRVYAQNDPDYPEWIQLRFVLDQQGTMIIIGADDSDKRKVENLIFLLQNNPTKIRELRDKKSKEFLRKYQF